MRARHHAGEGHQARKSEARRSRARRGHAARHEHHLLVHRRRSSLDHYVKQRGERPYTCCLCASRRPVRNEAALPGRREQLPRLRRARSQQRVRAATCDAGDRGLPQGWIQPAGPRWQARFCRALPLRFALLAGARARTVSAGRAGAEDQPARCRNLLPRNRPVLAQTGGLSGGGALVPRLSEIIPG